MHYQTAQEQQSAERKQDFPTRQGVELRLKQWLRRRLLTKAWLVQQKLQGRWKQFQKTTLGQMIIKGMLQTMPFQADSQIGPG